MDTNKGRSHDLISFALVALLLALITGLLVIIPSAIGVPPPKGGSVLAMIFLILATSTFLTNLIIPVAINLRKGILIALPTLGVLLYFYQIRPFVDYINPKGWLEHYYYIIMVACIFGPIIEILELLCNILFSRLGAIVNKKLFPKHAN